MVISAALVALAGAVALIGVTKPGRAIDAEGCPSGQLVGAPESVARGASPRPRPAVTGNAQ